MACLVGVDLSPGQQEAHRRRVAVVRGDGQRPSAQVIALVRVGLGLGNKEAQNGILREGVREGRERGRRRRRKGWEE